MIRESGYKHEYLKFVFLSFFLLFLFFRFCLPFLLPRGLFSFLLCLLRLFAFFFLSFLISPFFFASLLLVFPFIFSFFPIRSFCLFCLLSSFCVCLFILCLLLSFVDFLPPSRPHCFVYFCLLEPPFLHPLFHSTLSLSSFFSFNHTVLRPVIFVSREVKATEYRVSFVWSVSWCFEPRRLHQG